jgi:two-component sensor histidine kinase
MTIERQASRAGAAPRNAASYERELTRLRSTEIQLRDALAREEALLRQKDELIRQQELLCKESDHRLLNGLQIVASLLSLQSRASACAEAESQLAAAANRVAMIERVHRRLHGPDGVQMIAFKPYLQGLCRDFSTMLAGGTSPEQDIGVEGIEITLPSVIGTRLGFIVSELITNAVKYGGGRISVRLETAPGTGYALTVSNDGPGLPEGFDPAGGSGLGMKIVRSLVAQIGGELRFGRSEGNQGARFTILFS